MCSSIEEFEEIGLWIPGCRAAEIQVDFAEEHKILETEAQRSFLTKGAVHHVKIRERDGPSQGVTQKCEPLECRLSAPKFEDRTQEKRCAWEMSKNVHKLKDKNKTTFYSPSEVWSSPGPSSKKPKER